MCSFQLTVVFIISIWMKGWMLDAKKCHAIHSFVHWNGEICASMRVFGEKRNIYYFQMQASNICGLMLRKWADRPRLDSMWSLCKCIWVSNYHCCCVLFYSTFCTQYWEGIRFRREKLCIQCNANTTHNTQYILTLEQQSKNREKMNVSETDLAIHKSTRWMHSNMP